VTLPSQRESVPVSDPGAVRSGHQEHFGSVRAFHLGPAGVSLARLRVPHIHEPGLGRVRARHKTGTTRNFRAVGVARPDLLLRGCARRRRERVAATGGRLRLRLGLRLRLLGGLLGFRLLCRVARLGILRHHLLVTGRLLQRRVDLRARLLRGIDQGAPGRSGLAGAFNRCIFCGGTPGHEKAENASSNQIFTRHADIFSRPRSFGKRENAGRPRKFSRLQGGPQKPPLAKRVRRPALQPRKTRRGGMAAHSPKFFTPFWVDPKKF